jgi:hypothetical protein
VVWTSGELRRTSAPEIVAPPTGWRQSPMERRTYRKPSLNRLGLLRTLTGFSF